MIGWIIFLSITIGILACDINENYYWSKLIKDHKVLSVQDSETWIKKHSDEINIPDNIKFGKPFHLKDFGFTPYGIIIATDTNNKYRVIARELPQDKTLLEVGDILLPFKPFLFSRSLIASDNTPIDLKTEIETYVFKPKETIVQPYLEGRSDDLHHDFKCITYMSPNGATISYKISDDVSNKDQLGFIVTKINGTVFKRNHNLSPWRKTNQKDIPLNNIVNEWNYFKHRKKLLGCKILSVKSSKKWIEKYSTEIIIPDNILFGKPHYIQDPWFIPYGIMIALDANYNRRVIARKLPLDIDKKILKKGDTLNIYFNFTDNKIIMNEFANVLNSIIHGDIDQKKKAIENIENININFIFQAGEIIARPGLPIPNMEDRIGTDAYTIYTSPNGATISYNGFRIITKIDGIVFQRIIDLTEIATSLLE